MLATGRLEPRAPVLDRGVALVEAQSREAAHQARADEAGLGRERAIEQLDRGRVLAHGQTDEALEVEAVDVAGAPRQDLLALLERFEEETLRDEGLGQRLARVEVVGLLVEPRQDRGHARSGLGRELLEPVVEVGRRRRPAIGAAGSGGRGVASRAAQ